MNVPWRGLQWPAWVQHSPLFFDTPQSWSGTREGVKFWIERSVINLAGNLVLGGLDFPGYKSSLLPILWKYWLILSWPKILPRWRSGKETTCQCRRPGSIPELEWSPGEGNGNPFQYTCLGNSMDRGAWVWHKIVGLLLRKVEVDILVPTTSNKLVWLRILEIICKTNKEDSGRWREKHSADGDPEPPKHHDVPWWRLSFLLVSSVPDRILQ